jgi:hypothetical protein
MQRSVKLAFLAFAVLLAQGTWVLAGVTGTLNGTVEISPANTPVADVNVTASSASQTATSTTDKGGHFSFVSLVPDTYAVTATKENVIQETIQHGVTVVADQVVNLTIVAKPPIKTIGNVVVRAAANELVRPGQTANVYSVTAAAQARTASLGGGGSSDQGYSAIAALPGAYVPPAQTGWFQNVYIRGGDYDQVGYEFDGVPVNRSFDNYPTTNLSAIGQQELQLYTGASPASAESFGLAGYINQVIKSGTYPGFGTVTLGIGGPSLYNKASLEFGGATPTRNFSYYVGIGLIDSNPRYVDSNNGSSITQTYGSPYDLLAGSCASATVALTSCYNNAANPLTGIAGAGAGPGGYYMGPFPMSGVAHLTDRENTFNFHIGLPHAHDNGKDDIQLLYDAFQLYTYFYSSTNDWGGQLFQNTDAASCYICVGQTFVAGRQYLGRVGTLFTSADPSQSANVVNYGYPSEGAPGLGGPIPNNIRDSNQNGNGIYKLQYQRNISTSSYLRLYGYLFYSWWYIHGPNSTQANFVACCPSDYELWSHTRGLSASYVNQLSSKHLLNVETTYSTASTVRDNNTQMVQPFSATRRRFAVLVDANSPTNGLCYNSGSPGLAFSCEPSNPAAFRASWLQYATVQAGGIPAPGSTCGASGTDPCAWLIAENGPWATFNTVTPRFYAVSISDTWKPTDALSLNFGLRDDIYTFAYTPTGGGTRDFWFNAWNQANCVSPLFNNGVPFDETVFAGVPAGTPCSSVAFGPYPMGTFTQATLTNSTANGGQVTFPVLQPRIAGTYTFSPDTVLRFSYGRYSQPANAAYQQYNSLDQNLPNHLLGPLFFKFGYNGPSHLIRPSISNNYDLSIEHRLPNSDTSFKITPFLRQTSDQVQNLYIDPKTAFVSGLNAGRETNYGVEFLLSAGNFNANGWSAQLAYTYTHSLIRYTTLPNGGSPLDQNNTDIQTYNAFTAACAGATPSSSRTSMCGLNGGAFAFPCFSVAVGGTPGTGKVAAACTPSDVSNPYYNAPAQSLLDVNASYSPYDTVPAGVQLSSVGYVIPHEATLVAQYRKDKWSIIPSFQFHSGQRYGAPETMYGLNPSQCAAVLAGSVTGDPRYPFGGNATASPVDARSCGFPAAGTFATPILTGSIVIPDLLTGHFDNIGAFTEPSRFQTHLAIQYDASSRVSYQLNLANIVDTCFGGSKEPWTISNSHVCLYSTTPGFIPPTGNFYNPGTPMQTIVQFPYTAYASAPNGFAGYTTPFQAELNVTLKL